MIVRDTETGYGLVSRLMHWLMALAIVGLFSLGLWMVGLDYYSPYYHQAPDIHRSLGMLVLFALLLRIAWRFFNVHPSDADLSPLERMGARIVHVGFYPLLLALLLTGYLISTAEGAGIEVFGLFTVPAAFKVEGMEDTAGVAHRWLAYATIAVVVLHTLAALKHHFVDRSDTLKRMWSGPPANPTPPDARRTPPQRGAQ